MQLTLLCHLSSEFNSYLKFDSAVYFDCMGEEEVFLFSELTLKDEMQTRTFNFRGIVISKIDIKVVFGSDCEFTRNLESLKLCHKLI